MLIDRCLQYAPISLSEMWSKVAMLIELFLK